MLLIDYTFKMLRLTVVKKSRESHIDCILKRDLILKCLYFSFIGQNLIQWHYLIPFTKGMSEYAMYYFSTISMDANPASIQTCPHTSLFIYLF